MELSTLKHYGLHYVSDEEAGIRRKGCGTGFAYYYPNGSLIKDKNVKQRINALAIPPAYQDVWICPLPNGHLQATGYDSQSRKQYRYHEEWHAMQQATKFARLYDFGAALTPIRDRVKQDLNYDTHHKTSVLALMVLVLDHTAMRIGSQCYHQTHGTHGLTTLRQRHVTIHNDLITFEFVGKNSTKRHIEVKHKVLAQALQHFEELDGVQLFQYQDDDGSLCTIQSHDVNEYLKEIAQEDISAKDFRTWRASLEAFCAFAKTECPKPLKEQQHVAKSLIENIATPMGHTYTVCKNSYIHPDILSEWENGALQSWYKKHHSKHENSESLFLSWLSSTLS